MQRNAPLLALVAAAALAGCDTQPETIQGGRPYDPNANLTANSAPVVLPPAIVASHRYRCKDNSLVAIDWLSDGTVNSARVTPEGGTATMLAQAEAGGPYAAEGASLTGTPAGSSVTFNGKTCNR